MAKHLPQKKTNKPANSLPELPMSPELRQLNELLKTLPPDQRLAILTQVTSISMRSGPIPSAEEIEKYADVIPDAGDRIMRMAEKAQDAAIDERKADRKLAFRGQSSGTILAVILLIIGVLTLYMSWDPWVARIIFGVLFLQVLYYFIKSPNPQKPKRP